MHCSIVKPKKDSSTPEAGKSKKNDEPFQKT